ncbi:MAG: aminodeoxychorismate/anthranilate synthase component II [Candidatus Nanopelagicales bacterium]|nr:aminodeoxychorismate/anthranilate synthase component II [Candidatus Nanopelagicales bacterium]MDZ4248769.1 aminodeoxychorismate/anthranilate synthase component II [Candidatus Nanopelagicales bacterium]
MAARILVVDNYDSFVFNLVQYLQQLDAEVDVVRNDEMALHRASAYDGILLSPGPGTPERAGVCCDLIRAYGDRIPILGVCLGHQAIAVVHGAVVGRAPELLHGKTSEVHHDGLGVFQGLPSPLTATRYHSLAALPDTIPAELIVSATTKSGVIMGIRHAELPVEGVQFHPESVLTQGGHRMLANWLTTCGDSDAVARSAGLAPVVHG